MSLNYRGKIIATDAVAPIKPIGPFEEIDSIIKGDDGEMYLIPGFFDYMKIDKSLRSPIHKGYTDYNHVGQKVLFNYFEWNGYKIIEAILIDLSEIAPLGGKNWEPTS